MYRYSLNKTTLEFVQRGFFLIVLTQKRYRLTIRNAKYPMFTYT